MFVNICKILVVVIANVGFNPASEVIVHRCGDTGFFNDVKRVEPTQHARKWIIVGRIPHALRHARVLRNGVLRFYILVRLQCRHVCVHHIFLDFIAVLFGAIEEFIALIPAFN